MLEFLPASFWEIAPAGVLVLALVLSWLYNNNKLSNKFLDGMNDRDEKTAQRFERLVGSFIAKMDECQREARVEFIAGLKDTTKALTNAFENGNKTTNGKLDALVTSVTLMAQRQDTMTQQQDKIIRMLQTNDKVDKLEEEIHKMQGNSKKDKQKHPSRIFGE